MQRAFNLICYFTDIYQLSSVNLLLFHNRISCQYYSTCSCQCFTIEGSTCIECNGLHSHNGSFKDGRSSKSGRTTYYPKDIRSRCTSFQKYFTTRSCG